MLRQRRAALQGQRERRSAVARDDHVAAEPAEMNRNELEDVLVVVRDQDELVHTRAFLRAAGNCTRNVVPSPSLLSASKVIW